MATQNGKKLLDLIRKEVKQINRLNKRSERLVEDVETHNKNVKKLVAKMSEEDVKLYDDQFKRWIKQGIKF